MTEVIPRREPGLLRDLARVLEREVAAADRIRVAGARLRRQRDPHRRVDESLYDLRRGRRDRFHVAEARAAPPALAAAELCKVGHVTNERDGQLVGPDQ